MTVPFSSEAIGGVYGRIGQLTGLHLYHSTEIEDSSPVLQTTKAPTL